MLIWCMPGAYTPGETHRGFCWCTVATFGGVLKGLQNLLGVGSRGCSLVHTPTGTLEYTNQILALRHVVLFIVHGCSITVC